MASFQIDGKLVKKYDTENKSGTFSVREFVIETMDGQYTQYIKFQLVQDRCSLIDAHTEGQDLRVHFDLRGRAWQDKYFTTLNAWKIELVSAAAAPAAAAPAAAPVSAPAVPDTPMPASTDDLPF